MCGHIFGWKTITAMAFLLLAGWGAMAAIWPSTEEQSGPCKWGNKETFGECLITNFSEAGPAALDAYLISTGFGKIQSAEHTYYLKSANNLANYKIAVIMHTAIDGGFSIQIR